MQRLFWGLLSLSLLGCIQESPETLRKTASKGAQAHLLEDFAKKSPAAAAVTTQATTSFTVETNALPSVQTTTLDTTQPIATQAESPLTPASLSTHVTNPGSTIATIVQTETVTAEDLVGSTLIVPAITFLDTTTFTDGRNVQPPGPVTTIYRVSTDSAFPIALHSSSIGVLEFSSSNPAVATIAAGILTIVGAGTTVISVNQAKNGSYASGSQSVTLAVTSSTCELGTCQNGGVCHVAASIADSYINDSFLCACPTPYEGLRCEGTKTNCTPPGPTCQNGGTCQASPSGGACACTSCYNGPQCEEYNYNACPSQ